jgi:hypothetical protein
VTGAGIAARGAILAAALVLAIPPFQTSASPAAPALSFAEPVRATQATWAPMAHLYDRELLAPGGADATPAALSIEASGAEAGGDGAAVVPGKKKALLLSLLLPGAGEWSLGARGRATGFFISEGLIWTHYAWFQVAGHLRRNDYIEQAQLNAGVGVGSAADDYWKLVGKYATSSGSGPDAYEEELRREARDQFPNDPAAQDAWVAGQLPTGDRAWSWSSPELQQSYRDTRIRSNHAFDRAKYSFAAAILNRIVSVIDTQVIHRKLSQDAQARTRDEGLRLTTFAASDGSGRLVLTKHF